MRRLVLMLLVAAAIPVVAESDRFEELKSRLNSSQCVQFRFLSILESEIFDDVDTARGRLEVTPDGSYRLVLGNDEYFFDGINFWSYSRTNNQAVHETVRKSDDRIVSVSFLTRLDTYYKTQPMVAGRKYKLIRKSRQNEALPDTMIVSLRQDSLLIDEIKYQDINGELTRFLFLEQNTSLTCADSLFRPNFPDSVEKIEM